MASWRGSIALSLGLVCLARGQQSVLTAHYDVARTGANVYETTLTPANVLLGNFGQLAQLPVSGCVVAQPLYVAGVSLGDSGPHNIVYVATTANNLYAFDADTFTLYYQVNLGTPMPSADVDPNAGYFDFPNCDGVDGLGPIGVVGTPVIDDVEGALYVVANILDTHGYHHILHKLDLTNGADLVPAVEIAGASGGATYDPRYQLQRTALLLVNGSIYVAFSSHNDEAPYRGWLFAYDTSLNLLQAYTYSPQKSGAGIWQSGGGPAFDGTYIYVATGNNDEGVVGPDDCADSVLQIDPVTLQVVAKTSFPAEANDWDYNADLDLGSARVIPVPGTTFAVAGSKFGDMFVVDRRDMSLLNRFQGAARHAAGFDWTGIYNGFAYWNGVIYLWPGGGGFTSDDTLPYPTDVLKAFQLAGDSSVLAVATGQSDGVGLGYQGAGVVISANGNDPASGIVWALTPGGNGHWLRPGHLRAYSAADFSTGTFKLLWTDDDPSSQDPGYAWAKFSQPLVANGRVYVPTYSGSVIVYGLLTRGDSSARRR